MSPDDEVRLSAHASIVAAKRAIGFVELRAALESPDIVELKPNQLVHYCKRVEAREGRWLRVVVRLDVSPYLIVTAFFDRRLRRLYDHRNRR